MPRLGLNDLSSSDPSESMIVFVYQIRSYNKEDISFKGLNHASQSY